MDIRTEEACEGAKADRRLGKVYVDLCRPMAVTSRSGNLYSMNVIDNFSGYVWSIPLCSKADASPALQTWHKAVTVQSGETLCMLITDNSELVTKSTKDWCDREGIEHRVMAPYTSAQNRQQNAFIERSRGKPAPCALTVMSLEIFGTNFSPPPHT